MFDTATKQVSNIGVPGGNTWSIAFSPNGRVVYVTVDLGIAVIDTVTHAITKMITVSGGTPLEIAFTPNGAFAYVTNGGPLVSVIDASTHTEVSTVSIPNSAMGVAVSSQSPGHLCFANLLASWFCNAYTHDTQFVSADALREGKC